MHLFITGAGSFIGQALLAACDQRGIRVTGIDLRASQRPDCSVADIGAPDIAGYIPEDVDSIVHLAAVSRDGDSQGRATECFAVNVMGTLNLIDAARIRNARKFIFASSEWVYEGSGGPGDQNEAQPLDAARLTSEYALSKYVSENNLHQAFDRGFCPVTVLRFGIVYGPRPENWSAVEALLHAVATREDVSVGCRRTARRYVHVRDIAAAILAAQALPGYEIVNVQGPRLVSLGEIIEASGRLLERTPRIVETDPDRPSVRRVSDEKARRVLGWQAEVDIDEGLTSLLPALGLGPAILDAPGGSAGRS